MVSVGSVYGRRVVSMDVNTIPCNELELSLDAYVKYKTNHVIDKTR